MENCVAAPAGGAEKKVEEELTILATESLIYGTTCH